MPDQSPRLIRQLSAADLPLMRQLLKLFGETFSDPETYGAAPPDDTYLSRLLADENFICIAAVENRVVVGGLAAYVLRKFERARSEVYIYDLAVAEQHRRKGVATDLIRVLQAVAKDRGSYVIFVQADKTDDAAIALYTKLGAREDVLHFDIPVA